MPISITGASQLSTVSLTITFNPAALRVRAVQEGSFMRTGGVHATFTQQVDAAAGRVDIAIVRPGDATGVAGTGLLAAVLFDAVGGGPGESDGHRRGDGAARYARAAAVRAGSAGDGADDDDCCDVATRCAGGERRLHASSSCWS